MKPRTPTVAAGFSTSTYLDARPSHVLLHLGILESPSVSNLHSNPCLRSGSEEPKLKQMVRAISQVSASGRGLRGRSREVLFSWPFLRGLESLPFVWGRWASWWGAEVGWLPNPQLCPSNLDIHNPNFQSGKESSSPASGDKAQSVQHAEVYRGKRRRDLGTSQKS